MTEGARVATISRLCASVLTFKGLISERVTTMKNGTCLKCGSNEVYFNPQAGLMMTPAGMNAIPIKGSLFTSTAELNNYVCGQCGYVESYILNNRKLQEIVKHWTRVTPE
jgi:ribosomal protein S27AE